MSKKTKAQEIFSSLSPEEKRRVIEGDWGDEGETIVYGGGQRFGKTRYHWMLLRNQIKPPLRYEYIQGKHLVIIDKDEKRILCPLKSDRFPQDMVDFLEDKHSEK